jgi:hypothetical protein
MHKQTDLALRVLGQRYVGLLMQSYFDTVQVTAENTLTLDHLYSLLSAVLALTLELSAFLL